MRMTIVARTELALVEELIRRAIHLSASPGAGTSAPRGLIGFRASAADIPGLLASALDAAFGEAEAQGFAVIDVEVSGVMAIDADIRCWGTVEVANAAHPAHMPWLDGVPRVRREGTTLIADVSLGMREGAGS